ncbi:hypothetical protein TNCV_2106661 [Trichonephila clavipes]|nr:hypothetical protein TNCV_2106661 [Trichonephila clavipes]
MVAKRLSCQHTPVTTVKELWPRVEAAWTSVPVYAIQSLFDSLPKRISAVIIAGVRSKVPLRVAPCTPPGTRATGCRHLV